MIIGYEIIITSQCVLLLKSKVPCELNLQGLSDDGDEHQFHNIRNLVYKA
jgi:hypothetical protein